MAEVSPSLFDALEPAPDPGDSPSDLPEDEPLPLAGTVFEGAVSREPTSSEGVESFFDLVEEEDLGQRQQSSARVMASGATRGALVGSGAMAGGLSGAAIGTLVPPPAQVVTVPLGAFIGFVGGALAGDLAANGLAEAGIITSFEEVSPQQRPLFITGEVLGGGVSGTGATMAIARSGIRLGNSAVGAGINSILNYSTRNPVKFGLFETSAVISSAVGEGMFEVVRPGRPLERMGVGIAAGMLNPLNISLRSAQAIMNFGGRQLSRFSPAGRRTAAARELERLLIGLGGDPNAMLRELADGRRISENVPGFEPSGGTLTGDPMLQRIEQNLARLDETFLGDRATAIKRSQQALVNFISLLEATGDAAALQAALNLRKVRYDNMMDRLIAYAEVEARQAAQNIAGRDAPANEASRVAQQAEVSTEVFDIRERNLDLARQVERTVWENALGGADLPGAFTSSRRMLSRLEGESTELIPVPKDVRRQMQGFADAEDIIRRVGAFVKMPDGSPITREMLREAQRQASVGRMLDFRRDLLRLARGQARSTNPQADSLSRVYGLMAEAVLDDLVRVGAATKTGQVGQPGSNFGLGGDAPRTVRRGAGGRFVESPTALDDARAYTQALNDAYTRSFGGMAAQETAYGVRVPPETLMRRAMASGREAALQQVNELEAAMKFLPDVVRETSPELAGLMQQNSELFMDMQARYLRLLADETRLFSGEVNVRRLQDFTQRHGALLDKFPAIKADLEAAMSTQERLTAWTQRVTGLRRQMQRGTFGRMVSTDSPADFIRGVLNGRQPVTEMDRALNLARTGGDDALMGFKRSLWEVIFHRAGVSRGRMEVGMLNKTFNDPIRPGLPSMREYLTSRGLISSDNLQFLDDALKMERNTAATMSAQGISDDLVETQNALINLMVRMIGSELASMGLSAFQTLTGTQRNMASSLIVRTRGSQAMVHFTDRIPRMKIQDLMVDAFSGEPLRSGGKAFSLLEELLRPAATAQAQAQVIARLHAYALMAGLLGVQDEVEQDFPTVRGIAQDLTTLQGGDTGGVGLMDFLDEATLGAPATSGQGDALEPQSSQPSMPGSREPEQDIMDMLDEEASSRTGQFTDPREGAQGSGVPGLPGEELSLVAADIRREEGFRSRPYRNSRGRWTIGYGEGLEARGEVTTDDLQNMRITQEEANSLMIDRVAGVSNQISRRFRRWDSMTINQRRALVNMGYELGVAGLMDMKNMVTAVRRGDFGAVADHALQSQWAQQAPARAARVAALMRNGDN